jgi:hypothetical protein
MHSLIKKSCVLLMVCSPVVLAGCAHMDPSSVAKYQPPAPIVAEVKNPPTAAPAQPISQTGQLADALMDVFTTFTGH